MPSFTTKGSEGQTVTRPPLSAHHFFAPDASLTLITRHALAKSHSASREGFGPANQP